MNLLSDDESSEDHEETILQISKKVNSFKINKYKNINFMNLINEYLLSDIYPTYICNCCHYVVDKFEYIKCCNCLCNLCMICINGDCEKDDCYDQIKKIFDYDDYVEICCYGFDNFKEELILNEIFECKFCGKYQIDKNCQILHI
jgi:hypothetical protein